MKSKKVLFILVIGVLWLMVACSKGFESSPPNSFINLNGEKIILKKGGYHWKTREGFFSEQMTIADAASPAQIAEGSVPTNVEQNSIANIQFSDHSKPKLTYRLWEGEKPGKDIIVKGNKIKLPSKSGEYVFEVNASWTRGDASYTLFIKVQ